MSDEDLYDDDDTPNVRRMRDRIKALEEQVTTLTPRAEAGDKALRELAFAKAGISLTDPKTKYFVNGYDGDLTEEAIKAEAAEAGLLAPSEDTPDLTALDRIKDADTAGPALASPDLADQIAAATSMDELNILLRKNDLAA